MSKRGITVLLFLLTASLVGVAWYFLKDVDNERPEITFSGTPSSYTEGEDNSVLLANVTAFDNRDGDLTAEIRVNQITPIDDNTRARVTYVVIDSSKNIATASQIVDYTPLSDESTDESAVDDSVVEFTDAGTDDSSYDSPGDIATDEEALSLLADSEAGAGDVNPAAPVLVLRAKSGTILKEDPFDYMSYIESVTDDRDSKDELYRNIIIDGDYTTYLRGSYPLTLYVVDSDGNISNKETFILNRG